ncbi:hypothetical protein BJ944DRAFT_243241 [Cunninghamella echinulata]|nr:hypothetical protein BJ944DRAFT_243241 [Cunninghamella echinulata]
MKLIFPLLVFFLFSSSPVLAFDYFNIISSEWSVDTSGSKIYNWLKRYFNDNPFHHNYLLHSQSNGGGRYGVKLWNQGKGITVTFFSADKDIYTSVISAATRDDVTLQELENSLDDMAIGLGYKKKAAITTGGQWKNFNVKCCDPDKTCRPNYTVSTCLIWTDIIVEYYADGNSWQSQMFEELCGIWYLTEWMRLGKPDKTHIIEFGPGRGTLVNDMIRVKLYLHL